jgi:hypothetical protein
LPTEHGGWGFLFEPIVLGLAVAPSRGGFLVALAFIFGFLCRQPLRLGLQDALRGRAYPRTRWCWMFFAAYAACALASLVLAVFVSGWAVLIPIGLVAPMGLTQILRREQSGTRIAARARRSGRDVVECRCDRDCCGNAHRARARALRVHRRARDPVDRLRAHAARPARTARKASWPSLALHAIAILLVALFAKPFAVAAMVLLFVRAA